MVVAAREAGKQPEWARGARSIISGAFRENGLDVEDEGTVYAMLRAYWFAYETMQKRFMDGQMDEVAFARAGDTLIGFAIALLPYIPEEARTHG